MDPSTLLPTDIEWWQIIVALIVVVVGWILARLAKRGTTKVLRRVPGISEPITVFAARFTQYLILLLAVGTALALLGANVQPLLAAVAIVVVIAVLVLRGVADNFAASVLIQTRHPVRLGDEVQVEGPDGELWTGVVNDLNARSVVLLTYDGLTVHVPNAKLLADPLVNASTHGIRRSEVQVRVARDGRGVDELLAAISDAASVHGVLSEPAARALPLSISPERLTARVQFWHAPADGLTATASVVQSVAAALEATGGGVSVTSERPAAPLVRPDAV